MHVVVDAWAWFEKGALTITQLQAIRAALTILPRKVGDHPGDPPGPIRLFTETPTAIGVAREYFLQRKRADHEVEFLTTEGNQDLWGGAATFTGALKPEQRQAVDEVAAKLRNGRSGGIIRAAPGWGKTVCACALIAELKVPTLVVVHKEFLVNQWKERIAQFLPDAKIGIVQQDTCEFDGRSVVIAMVHSLVEREYPSLFYRWPGLVITDEVHRIGAETWSLVPPKFPARWRLGFSATPRRKDGADDVFFHHIGAILFVAKEKMLPVKVRRVWTKFRLMQTPSFNPGLLNKALLVNFLCASDQRNRVIVEQIVLAVLAGRKIMVLSERLQHLSVLEQMLHSTWPANTKAPVTGHYVGGMSREALDDAAEAQVIFATSQLVTEGLDIPALDTLFLTSPLSDVEQAVGRIQRTCEGKKDPVVVDFRDDLVTKCKKLGASRDKFYRSRGWLPASAEAGEAA